MVLGGGRFLMGEVPLYAGSASGGQARGGGGSWKSRLKEYGAVSFREEGAPCEARRSVGCGPYIIHYSEGTPRIRSVCTLHSVDVHVQTRHALNSVQ